MISNKLTILTKSDEFNQFRKKSQRWKKDCNHLQSTTMTTHCVLCLKDISQLRFVNHLPKCYINYCKKNDLDPLCTCKKCNGSKTHPDDDDSETEKPLKKRPKASTTTKTEAASPLQDFVSTSPSKDDGKSNKSTPPKTRGPAIKLNQMQMTGKRCIVCNNYRSSGVY
jgi:hypothetical protein